MSNRLKELRMHKLIESQRELAIQVNKKYGGNAISYGTIATLERGEGNPRWKTILMLSDFFGVTPQYLMGYVERRN